MRYIDYESRYDNEGKKVLSISNNGKNLNIIFTMTMEIIQKTLKMK